MADVISRHARSHLARFRRRVRRFRQARIGIVRRRLRQFETSFTPFAPAQAGAQGPSLPGERLAPLFRGDERGRAASARRLSYSIVKQPCVMGPRFDWAWGWPVSFLPLATRGVTRREDA